MPQIAVGLDIHVSTPFYWRHKILNALRSLGHLTLQGIVESDKGKKGGALNIEILVREVVKLKNVRLVMNKCQSWWHLFAMVQFFQR